jgi:glycosyltransferase involved in cell wall biosynthesis
MARHAMAVAALPRRLDTNPYCELLYDHVEKLGVAVVDGRSGVRWLVRARRRVAVLHFHWPERHFRQGSLASALGFALRLCVARFLGYRIVWTVHNAVPHEGTGAGDRLVRAVLRRVARLVVHCEAARRTLGPSGRDALVIPHGSYVGRYPNGITPAAARQRLGLEPEARVFLAFGQVRPYKNLDALARVFRGLDAPDARLVIAGEPVCGTRLALVDDPRVRLFLRHVEDAEVQVFFNAADLVVLPYRAVLTSGAAMLALSFGRGVVAPRLGCLAELERSGAVCLYDPEAPDGLADALRRALALDPTLLGQKARRFVRGLSWDAIARRHLAAYGFAPALSVVAATGRRPSAERPGRAERGTASAGKDRIWT